MPGANFSHQGSHVLPALIRRYDEAARTGAPSVTNWGTSTPRREFMRADVGWRSSIGLEEGLRSTVAWYRDHAADLRG